MMNLYLSYTYPNRFDTMPTTQRVLFAFNYGALALISLLRRLRRKAYDVNFLGPSNLKLGQN